MTVNFGGTHGSAIYVKRYLSTMFEISDVLVDKEELAMALNIEIKTPDEAKENSISDSDICVSNYLDSVSKSTLDVIVQKVVKVLSLQGFACPQCPKIQYILLPLSECKDTTIIPVKIKDMENLRFLLVMKCSDKEIFGFDVTLKRSERNGK